MCSSDLKKPVAKKAAPVKKVPAKKPEAKKAAPVKKAPAKQPVAKKAAPAKNAPAKKPEAMKAAPEKKASVKQSVAKNPETKKEPVAAPKTADTSEGISPKPMTAKELERSRKAEQMLQKKKIGGFSNDDLLDLIYPDEEKVRAENRLSKKELKEMKDFLLAERKRLLQKAESLQGQSLTRADEVNPEEDGTDANLRVTELKKANMAETSVGDIDEALRAIEKGTYGICESCKQRIGRERLKAHPAAKCCVKCQELLEHDAKIRSMADQKAEEF